MLRAYRVAAVAVTDLVTAASSDPTVEDVVALNRVLLTSVDRLSEALFTGYTSGTVQLTSDRESMLQRLFDDMVAGRQNSTAALRDRAEQLGLDVPAQVSLLLVRRAESSDDSDSGVDDDVLTELASGTAGAGWRRPAERLLVLRRAENSHLMQGLAAYLRAGSSAEAAASLDLHPQTIRHRLRRISALTGRDPRRSWDRFVLDLARAEVVIAGGG